MVCPVSWESGAIGGKCYAAIASGSTSAREICQKSVTRFVFLGLLAGGQKSVRRSFGFQGCFFPGFYPYFRVPETSLHLYPVRRASGPVIGLCRKDWCSRPMLVQKRLSSGVVSGLSKEVPLHEFAL